MKVLGVTLARGGSKGIPRKNIRTIAGKPLLAWTIHEVLKSELIDNYVVSTDDETVRAVAQNYGAPYVVMRPPELAKDDTPSLDALKHALYASEGLFGQEYDVIAMIPCTNPLKTVEDIDGAIEGLTPEAQSVIGVSETYPVERIKTINEDGYIRDTYEEPKDGQRQFLPDYYVRNGSIYLVRRDSLDKLFGHDRSLAYVLPKERGINIDDLLDWMVAEMLLERRNK